MNISFKNVVPKPLEGQSLDTSQIWQSTFEISKAGHYIINASSGKGKSTFINLLYGLRQDYEGEVLFNQLNIKQFGMLEWSAKRSKELSIVFQSLELFPNLSVLDNILIKNKLSDFKTENEIKEALTALEMDGLSNNLAGTLSMGQQQRVAIVRALCQPFSCLLLDEPFSHLDNDNIQKAWQLIDAEVKRQGAKTITTTLGNDYGIESAQTFLL